jgi:hypothetical protein
MHIYLIELPPTRFSNASRQGIARMMRGLPSGALRVEKSVRPVKGRPRGIPPGLPGCAEGRSCGGRTFVLLDTIRAMPRGKRRIGSVAAELVKKARDAMLTAVQIFNNPQIEFRSELFIVATVIAWTYLLHAYYRKKGIEHGSTGKRHT